MALADLIHRVRERGRQANETARELAVRIVEGANVKDEQIEAACRDAGMAYEEFASLLSTLEARKAAYDKFHERDYDAEMAATMAEYKQAHADERAVEAEQTALREERTRLIELGRSLMGKRSRIEREKKEAIEVFRTVLGENRRDWRIV